MNVRDKIYDRLIEVESPERYIGNEYNIIKKEWDADKIKVLTAFPDAYEIGMSHIGLKIIYHLMYIILRLILFLWMLPLKKLKMYVSGYLKKVSLSGTAHHSGTQVIH